MANYTIINGEAFGIDPAAFGQKMGVLIADIDKDLDKADAGASETLANIIRLQKERKALLEEIRNNPDQAIEWLMGIYTFALTQENEGKSAEQIGDACLDLYPRLIEYAKITDFLFYGSWLGRIARATREASWRI